MTVTGSFEELLTAVRNDPARRNELVALLHEANPAYRGHTEAQALQKRAAVLEVFEQVGLPDSAVPAVLEVLHTGMSATILVGAARAARGLDTPSAPLACALATALRRRDGLDEPLYGAADTASQQQSPRILTARSEILTTLIDLGPMAHASHATLLEIRDDEATRWAPALRVKLAAATDAVSRRPLSVLEVETPRIKSFAQRPVPDDLARVLLEDQTGRTVSYSNHFKGRFHVVAFFYTRCGNPRKCSATITRLGRLQTLIEAQGLTHKVAVSAVTYDPGYDSPQRLSVYGSAHGLQFGQAAHMLRAPSGHELLREFFDLSVGYSGSLVNQHGLELYLVGPGGYVRSGWLRTEWDPDEVLRDVCDALRAES